MFEQLHHRRIAAILASLDGDRLRKAGCWFGGGTAIALLKGEYRESVDMDFLVSDLQGYRWMRQHLDGAQGLDAVLRPGAGAIAIVGAIRPINTGSGHRWMTASAGRSSSRSSSRRGWFWMSPRCVARSWGSQ